jgi:serine/threonine-protein kinase RsbW
MTSASATGTARNAIPALQGSPPPVAWWGRDFPGGPDQVGEARHWIADLLPDCDPLHDVLLLTSELCANAVVHTRSGEAGGRFSVDVEWSPELARVVVGDQGSPGVPVAGAEAKGMAWAEESGRGLWLVDAMAAGWGTASHPEGRWVWFDVDWQARGGPPLAVPGDTVTAIRGVTAIRAAFPGTTYWWGQRTRRWQAALPGTGGLVSAPTQGLLCQALADAYPGLAPPAAPRGNPAWLAHPPGNRSRKGTGMIAAQCSCGFEELNDETLADHFQQVFEPDDRRGTDGQEHVETSPLVCVCGYAAVTSAALDGHFLKVFVPPGAVGRDGKRHEPAGASHGG